MEKGREKRIISILMTLTIIFTLMGGTLSYLRWQTSEGQKTNVVFTVNQDFSCAADGGGNIQSATLMPASCTNPKYAIQRTVTVTPEIKVDNLNVVMDLWLDINTLGSGLSQSQYFKYALTTEENSCTTGIVSQGTFTGLSAENDDKVMLLNQQEYSTSQPQTYYLYIWIDPLEDNNYILEQPFNFSLGGSCTSVEVVPPYTESILKGTDPELESGMIPVTISDTGAVTVADITQKWYKYEDKEWANAVLVNSTSRSTYINRDGTFNANTPIPEDDILAYYVWIPRYKYTFPKADGNPETISIIFENSQTPKSIPASGKASGTDYYTHPAFTFGDKELNGIWVGKFETTGDVATPTILPDESSLVRRLVAGQFTTAILFAGGNMDNSTGNVSFSGNNTYGLTNQTDSHMMKNSEWGAVAYLSHSVYGINEEVRINNYYNNGVKTGCGALAANAETATTCGIPYGTPSTEVNVYPQSTTGNISGIFDMSGGVGEYVMGRLDNDEDDRSAFINFPSSKYYDLYLESQFTGDYEINISLCTVETCGGHALNETAGWYSDLALFIDSIYPWFLRGGNYYYDANAGAFGSNISNGSADYPDGGFRAVLVKGA